MNSRELKKWNSRRYYLHTILKDADGFNPRKRLFLHPKLTSYTDKQFKCFNVLVQKYGYVHQKSLFDEIGLN
jgi:hypothetical protein